MRRSKSNPAKYAKNYKRISQRKMIHDDDHQREIEQVQQQLQVTHCQLQGSDTASSCLPSREIDASTSSNNNMLLSPELQADVEGYGQDDTPLIVASKKKKQTKPKRPACELTPLEVKAAKKKQKQLTRKLEQLQKRQLQKETRQKLYDQLESSKLVNASLLQSSATLGQRHTKKQQLSTLLQKERAGLVLTESEKDLLYRNVERNEPMGEDRLELEPKPPPKGSESSTASKSVAVSASKAPKEVSSEKSANPTPPTSSLAAQMMASLATLQQSSNTEAEPTSKEPSSLVEMASAASTKNDTPAYRPSKTVEIKTTQSYEPVLAKIPPSHSTAKKTLRHVVRPVELQQLRESLPIFAMEFELLDAIQSSDVTIVCAETGSGKSTQLPQFLYEHNVNGDKLIGITQPRRVAAVSTAKRVAYELTTGNGYTISSNNNLVGYQTRYERAGLGKATCIKFMTDGILLAEIQSDLLLRQYNVLVIDEAHERNLNTDVLIGLLSSCLELRKQAAAEDESIQPLKVIIMSATLRVEDFCGADKKLFQNTKPCVVQVPGRTHPVTIHHSKVTELEKYEDVAFQKTCKIHRQLPKGGILVFLTGKQEIIRMVNRLRSALCPSQRNKLQDQSVDMHEDFGDGPRDMDDDEIDGDLFQDEETDLNANLKTTNDAAAVTDRNNNIPEKAIVLPLYSLLSTEEQARVFDSVPEGHRLVVVSTNIAETSITIPGVSYVVDTGRQKSRNYNAETGVASFDVMWISKASADQRAGRAGRTGPGHCYRLYSSSLYSRHMDDFSLPEVLTRPLEDVVLAMKAMKISNIADFPFPTPPDSSQVAAAVKLLADIGCVDVSNVERNGGDGVITRLGMAVSKLPLGVRYGKMLLVAAEAGVLDYAIVVVAALSETDPFVRSGQSTSKAESGKGDDSDSNDSKDKDDPIQKQRLPKQWAHKGGDVLAALLAVGAYTYAGRGAGGFSETLACRKFCEENGLHVVVMQRIQKMRKHLARLAQTRLCSVDSVASKTGRFTSSMRPPDALQERLLKQAVASGLLDNVAMLAPVGSISGTHPYSLRTAYLGCSSSNKEPLFMDRNSVLFSRDSRVLPQWICYEHLMRKTLKDGTPIAVMKTVTPIDASWLARLAFNSRLLKTGEPISSPLPVYDLQRDAVLCSVKTKFGSHGWEIPPMQVEMYQALQSTKETPFFRRDDSFRWFARFLLEGQVIPELKSVQDFLNDSPTILTRPSQSAKVALLVSALSTAGIDSASALQKHWAEIDDKFLFVLMKKWVRKDCIAEFKSCWRLAVHTTVEKYRGQ